MENNRKDTFLMITLRDYQIENSNKALSILEQYGIVYLSMEVRSGKTLTALQTANMCNVQSVLFITKKKAISSITNDYNLLSPGYQIAVINYESIHKIDLSHYDLFIIDEAHSLGAFPKQSNRAKNINTGFKPVIYLSGTPTPESWSQLYHQFKISKNTPFKLYPNFYKWAAKYVNIKKKMIAGNMINDYSNANIEEIQKVTKHLFISYTQKEAGFEQTINEKIITVPMTEQTKTLIKRLEKDLVIEGQNEIILADTPVKLMQKVHQLSSGTIKFESGNYGILDKSKAVYIKELFKGQKIAIFYKFKAEFELLKEIFTDWTNDLEEFNSDNNKTFLVQIVSGREGINLSIADSLVFYNIDFSATSYFQARDRLTSKTRTKENNVYWIFSDVGFENKVYNTVKNKTNFTKAHYVRG